MMNKNNDKAKLLGCKLLVVDDIPPGALPKYERDVQIKSYVISRRGAVPMDDAINVVTSDEVINKVKNYMMKWINNDQNNQ